MTHQPSSSPARAARACLVARTPRRRGGRQGRRRPGPGRGEDGIRRHRHEDGGRADDEEGEHPPRRSPGAEPVERGRHGRGQGGRDDDDDGTGRLPRPQAQPVQADEHQHGSRWVTREVDRPVVGRVERDAGDILPQQRPDVVDPACAGEVLGAVVEDAAQPARSVDEGERHHPDHRGHPRQGQQPPPRPAVQRSGQPGPSGQRHECHRHGAAPAQPPRPVTEQGRRRPHPDVDTGQRRHGHGERDEDADDDGAAPPAGTDRGRVRPSDLVMRPRMPCGGTGSAPWAPISPSRHTSVRKPPVPWARAEPRVATWTSTATS